MSADLHIHILDGNTTEEEIRYFNGPISVGDNKFSEAYDHIARTPNIWIGEVSWLKASLFGDSESYIPDPVNIIQEVIGYGVTVMNDDILIKIVEAFNSSNKTSYDIARKEEVKEFLEKYRGEKIFTVSW